MTTLSCSNCKRPAKLLWAAGVVEWWRCSVPSCGYLFSAYRSVAAIRSQRAAFHAIPPAAQQQAMHTHRA